MPEHAPMLHFQDSFELKNAYTGVPKPGEPMPLEQQIHLIHGYYACVSYIDAQIGKVLDTLQETGKDKNTIIVLWADHGFHLGDHGMWCKHTNYEQATRIPLMIAGPPGMLPVNSTHAPVDLTDLYPTLCELAGLPKPETYDGTSLVPLLHDPMADVKPAARSQYPRQKTEFGDVMGYAFRDRRYRYVQWRQMDAQGNLGRGPVVARELYDYQTDPLETVNLIDHPASRQVVERFEAMVTADNTGLNKAVFTRQPVSIKP
ncbi:MAG: sulfatase-like hydrolase/transferase [Phycisphaerales bacterium]|nr:sulfatase-like hydrolase/transferase [Phycisphaerales bacterium]